MNKLVVGVGLTLMACGCASVEMAKYKVTSYAEVTMSSGAKVKVVSNGNVADETAAALKKELQKGKKFTVVDGAADYWIVLSAMSEYAKPSQIVGFSVEAQESADGGSERIVEGSKSLSAGSLGISVSVYDSEKLSPVCYFQILMYDGDLGRKARSEQDYATAFAKDASERLSDVFITQEKEVETAIPVVADGTLRDLFKKGDYTGFEAAYAKIGPADLTKLCEDLKAKTYEGPNPKQMFANCYLDLLVKELNAKSRKDLEAIYKKQLMIVENCDEAGIAESVPVALARLEYKLAHFGK